jgi:hypothetical protein
MNTLSSLPPPAFGDVALRGTPPVAPAAQDWFERASDGGLLHAGGAAGPRAIDDIERDFVDALCENHAA